MSGKKKQRPVVVPVDFSSGSDAALNMAFELGHCFKQRVIALHVVHDPAHMPGYYRKIAKKKDLRRMEDLAREIFDDYLKEFKATHPNFKSLKKLESMLVVGLPVTKILQVAEAVDASMIVMGGTGSSGWKSVMLGSTAEQVVRHSMIPVTIVKVES